MNPYICNFNEKDQDFGCDNVIKVFFLTPRWYVILGIVHIKPSTSLTRKWFEDHKLAVRKITVHSGFKKSNLLNDIAIIQLEKKLSWTTTIKPICLPGKGDFLLPDDTGYVAGWGRTHQHAKTTSELLKHQKFRIRTNSTCNKATLFLYDQNAMFCAGEGKGKTDTCTGDSGGAFATQFGDSNRWYAVGIVSFGGWGKQDCATEGTYGYFTRLGTYLDWISNITVNRAQF